MEMVVRLEVLVLNTRKTLIFRQHSHKETTPDISLVSEVSDIVGWKVENGYIVDRERMAKVLWVGQAAVIGLT